MAEIKVKYTKTFEQTIDWPDDEMELFNHDSLLCNLDIDESTDSYEDGIVTVQVNGSDYDF